MKITDNAARGKPTSDTHSPLQHPPCSTPALPTPAGGSLCTAGRSAALTSAETQQTCSGRVKKMSIMVENNITKTEDDDRAGAGHDYRWSVLHCCYFASMTLLSPDLWLLWIPHQPSKENTSTVPCIT